MTDIHAKFPALEYQEHPAFSSIDPGKSINYISVLDRLKELEDKRKKLQAPKSLWSILSWKKTDKENAKQQYSDFVKNCHKELEIVNKEILGTRNDWSTYEINSINKLIEHIKNEVVADTRVLWWQAHAPQEIEINDREARECLIDNGYAAFQLDPKSVTKLRSLVSPLETDLRNMDTRNPCMWACKLVEPTVYPEFIDYLQNCLKDLNVFAIAGNYLKRDVFIEYTHLNVSRPEDEWWRTRYRDMNLELPATAGMHYDSSAGMMKVMLYLNDVDIESGTFCYLPKTKPAYNKTDFFRKLSGKASLYAGITLDNQESRRLLLRLPNHFRNISHFGDDLLIGGELERSYQSVEKKFTGDKGLTILFDNYGLHRGGMTQKGERVALQISLRAVDSYSLL